MNGNLTTTFLTKICAAIILAITLGLNAYGQEVLNNEMVIEMHKNGFSPGMIVSKIRSSEGKYDVSIASMLALKKAGLSDEVMQAMMDANNKSAGVTSTTTTVGGSTVTSTSNRRLGIYWAKEVSSKLEYVQVEPTVFRKTKTGGMFASAITYGLAKTKSRAVFPGLHSMMQIESNRPVFYFYTNESPKNYSLVRLEVKKKDRQIVVAQGNIFSYESGIADTAIVQFEIQKVEEGVYKVIPTTTMQPGEYAFFYGADESKAYDFGIKVVM